MLKRIYYFLFIFGFVFICSQSLADTVILPSNILHIEKEAFANDSSISTALLPEGILTIDEKAFAYTNLESINLPKSLTYISGDAFEGCNLMIATVYESSYALEYCQQNNITYNVNYPCIIGDYTFRTLEDGTSAITGYNGTERKITLPKYDSENKPVTVIDKDAFNGNKAIIEVVIPNGYTTIGYGAFWDCYNLSKITISDSVKTIERYAFVDDSNLKTVIMSKNIKRIERSAFTSCINLEFIEFPSGIIEIGDYAFDSCWKLKDIVLPSSLIEIGINPFNNSFIETFSVAEDNPALAVINNALFSKDGKHLISFPCGMVVDKYILPEGCEEIDDYALYGYNKVNQFILPNTLKIIGKYAFTGTHYIDHLIVPNGVIHIKQGFCDTSHLSWIYIPPSVSLIEKCDFLINNNDFIIYVDPDSYAEEYVRNNYLRYSTSPYPKE